jgi:phosphoserine phosphatase
MRRILGYLTTRDVEVWLVSGSNQWLIEAAALHFAIPRERVLATAVHIDRGLVTSTLIRVPCGRGKVEALLAENVQRVDLACGNSIYDRELLSFAQNGIATNPSPELLHFANQHGWNVFQPALTVRP